MSDFNQSLPHSEAPKAKINTVLKAEDKVQLFRQMVRIRAFEERAVRAYQQSHIGGFCHTYIGQESVAVGMLSLLGPDDHCITAYRDHAHALMVGMTMNECMAELYGKYTGCSKGKGGSMHYFAPDKNYWGGHGIVGAQTPLGAGIAFAIKYEGKKGACLCYLGDGAVNQGAFHEALNLAALWELPVIYVIENNRYSMGTSQARSSAGSPLAKRAEGYGMNWAMMPGNDVYVVRAQTQAALDYTHKTSRPMILEVDTYRYRGHSMSDPDQTYRSKEEITEYRKKHDPILIFAEVLKKEKVLDDAKIEEIEAKAREEAEAAAQFATASPFPPAEEIYKDVYWETDAPNERTSQGTLYFT